MSSLLMNAILPPWLTPQRPVACNAREQPSRQSPTQSLKYYSTPGVFPPSARVDPKLKRQPRRPLHLWEYWKYAAFLAVKGEVADECYLFLCSDSGFHDSYRINNRCAVAPDMGPSQKVVGH